MSEPTSENKHQNDGNKATGAGDKHWLYRPENKNKLWAIQITLLVLVVIPEFFVHHHAHFPESDISIDTSFGFFAWYGFVTCAVMVVAAKLLGFLLKRSDDYYDR